MFFVQYSTLLYICLSLIVCNDFIVKDRIVSFTFVGTSIFTAGLSCGILWYISTKLAYDQEQNAINHCNYWAAMMAMLEVILQGLGVWYFYQENALMRVVAVVTLFAVFFVFCLLYYSLYSFLWADLFLYGVALFLIWLNGNLFPN